MNSSARTQPKAVGLAIDVARNGAAAVDPEPIHVVLNFVVPYCVSSYSATRNELRKIGES